MEAATIEDLRVDLDRGVDVVDEISLQLRPGEIVALVGESGSGKTTVGTAMLRYARRGARIAGGKVTIGSAELLALSAEELRELRGCVVAYIPQEPSAALNPAIKIGRQLEEVVIDHESGVGTEERRRRVREAMADVGLPADADFLARYPHQLSGGQQQRVAIGMAIILRPQVLVLDEPTTGLDVTTQARILDTVGRLCGEHSIAALYVTHDLAVVRQVADSVIVLYGGRIVERGSVGAVFATPAHPYTQALLTAVPDISLRTELAAIPGRPARPGERPQGCSFHPRCAFAVDRCRSGEVPVEEIAPGHSAHCHRAREAAEAQPQLPLPPRSIAGSSSLLLVEGIDAHYGETQVLHDVSFVVREGECVALVGESGSGKTTLAQCVIGLHRRFTGTVALHGKELDRSVRKRAAEQRRSLQYVFQSPYNSLNPRRTVGDSIGVSLRTFEKVTRAAAKAEVGAALERVELSAGLADAYPDELSGGERQRVSIARALVARPEILICDEVTSALDVSVQAAIVELLRQLQRDDGLSLIFVTHNLALVRSIADSVLVMNQGVVVEQGDTATVLDAPQEAYTQKLLTDTPSILAA